MNESEFVPKYHINVIPFDHRVKWAIYCFLDDYGKNVVRSFLDEVGISEGDHMTLDRPLDLIELQGPNTVRSLIDRKNGFFELTSRRTGGLEIHLVFHRETFGPREITFLAAAVMKNKKLRPGYVQQIAEERLEDLRDVPRRRRRERPTQTLDNQF